MIPKLIAFGAGVISVAFAEAAESPNLEVARLRLACTGFMMTAGQEPPGSRIIADGVVDFPEMRVRGFGIGSVRIVSATAEKVKFGSSPLEETVGAHTFEGTINRITGETQVVVRSAKAPSAVVIAMDLDCRPTPQAGN
jgi:hypothetical protein